MTIIGFGDARRVGSVLGRCSIHNLGRTGRNRIGERNRFGEDPSSAICALNV